MWNSFYYLPLSLILWHSEVYEAVGSDVFFTLLADMISYNKLCQLANGELKYLFL